MLYLTLEQILDIHHQVIGQTGGGLGITNRGLLESAFAQPKMTFGGQELYTTLAEKAAALGFSLIKNHPFLDGNKRTGHAAMEVFLILNGFEINANVEEQERVILQVASGEMTREEFTHWLQSAIIRFNVSEENL
ncbi:type II toxin-antitoxin system death-on-curing family toxin [Microcoleus sp. N9_B4]|jgi:death-on-curing protein|uniref:type II toxin-antitoxin system death-on-curing family toxin n=1 Tax=Microcoleus sp. N9_B4 TaxID=3055386 RepID=UPI002FD3B45C